MFSSSFGSTNNTFGGGTTFPSVSQNSGGMFGQPQQQQQQPAASTSLFGGGGFNQAKPAFGTTFGTQQNQQTASVFGQQNRLPVPATGGIFSGQTAAVSPFTSGTTATQSQSAGTPVQFQATTGNDTMMKNGVASPISTRHQCITCMKEYENKSLEELRLEDYQLNRKGPQQGSMFGMGGAQQQQQQQNTGMFSGMGTATSATPFGQTSAFGTNTSTAGGSIFSSLNQPKPSGFFSTPATSSTPAFGATSTGFSFSNPTNTTTSAFGAPAVSTTGGLGTSSAFSFGQPQAQAQAGSLFGAKPATSTSTGGFGSSFGVPTLSNTTATSKPPAFGFGSQPTTSFGTNPATTFGTGTGSLFGTQNQQAAKPFSFSTPFSSQPQASQPSFGSTGGTNFTFTTTTSAPTLNFGGSGTTPSFGSTLGGGTTNTFGTPGNTFSLGGGLSSTGFGSTSFGLGSNTGTGGGIFSNTTFSQPLQQQAAVAAPAPVSFASSPYKDSPLFYNLVANRNLDEMVKPTSPAAQRAIKDASRRRASTSINVPSANGNKNVTFPIAKPSSSLNRSIFDGSEEENKGISIDILSPKTSVKKLALKNLRNNSTPNHRHSFSFSSPTTKFRSGFDTFNDSFQSNENDSPRSQAHNNMTSDIPSGSNKKKSFDDSPIQTSRSTGTESNQLNPPVSDRINSGDTRRQGCGILLTRPGYYIKPSIEELDQEVDEQGNCFVNKFVVGRLNHGEIRFLQTVNVAGLNLDEIVHFRHKEVVVYPENYDKPPLGQGLNVPAEISLERVWPIDKATGDPIKYSPKLGEMNYEGVLRKACVRLDAEFVSYTADRGIWTFKVSHFSKYSCDVEEAEEENKSDKIASVTKGLGGMPLQQINSGLGPHKQISETAFKQSDRPDIEPSGLRKFSNDRSLKILDAGSKFINHSTPISRLGRSLADMEANCSEVEHNPLTPSESESETDLLTVNGRNPMGFDSILNEKSRIGVSMMQSVMLMDVEEPVGDIADFQPPIKRSKPTAGRLLTTKIDPTRKDRPVDPRETKNKTPFVSSSKPDEQQQKPVTVARYLPTIKKMEPIKLEITQEDLFKQLRSDVAGPAIRPVPRVCFGPLGLYLTAANLQNGSYAKNLAVNIFRLKSYVDKYPHQSLIRDTLGDQIDLELFVDHRESIIAQHIGHIHTSLKVEDVKGRQILSEELVMWELCEILWPTLGMSNNFRSDKGFPIRQRIKLSRWLKKHWKYLFGEVDSDENTVLGLMKKGKRRAAAQLALKSADYVLAACASQTLTSYGYTVGGQQLKVWIEKDAVDFVSPDTLKVLKLCCGRMDLTDVDFENMTTSEWFQYFALHLWYHTPTERSVDMTVHSYLDFLAEFSSFQMSSEGKLGSETTLTYPAKPEPSIRSLCIQLLKLYSFMGYPLKLVLDPKVYSVDILDYRLSWLLMVTLEKFGYICDEDLRSSITISFVGQLEQIGLSDRAKRVLEKLKPSVERETFSQRIAERSAY